MGVTVDHWRKYRPKPGYPQDRRVWWASEDRELVLWEAGFDGCPALSKYERKLRGRFYGLVEQMGMDPAKAVEKVLELHVGPILEGPGKQTRAEFGRYWSAKRLKEIGERWRRSRHYRPYEVAKATALMALKEKGEDIMRKTIQMAFDPKTSDAVRGKMLLELSRMVQDRQAGGSVGMPRLEVGPELLERLKTDPAKALEWLMDCLGETDTNRARLLKEIKETWLKAHLPEQYGEKMKVSMEGNVSLTPVLERMRQKREMLEEEERKRVEGPVVEVES